VIRDRLVQPIHFAERVWNRGQRIWADTSNARMSAELSFRADRDAHRVHLPTSSSDDDLLEALRRDGIVMTTVERLGLGGVAASAEPLVSELLSMAVPPDLPATHLPPDRLITRPDIFRWGAEDRILNLLERYFEVPVAFHGVYLRRDMAVAASGASNLWHLDMEDRHVLKVVVYLTDMQDGDGSFTYVDLERSTELRRSLGSTYRLGPDEQMRKLVPEDAWQTVKGPAGTVLISDTALLFHKGQRPRHRDRATLFYDYTSRRPLHPFYCKSALPRRHLEDLTAGMGGRAKDAVFWRPRLKEFDPVRHE